MIDSTHFFLFCTAALALLVVPGPSVTYIVARSVDQGGRAGLVSVLGIHTGTLVHVFAAVAGLSAVIASSAVAFSVVKYAGAVYLIFIGVRRLMSNDEDIQRLNGTSRASYRRVYWQAVMVNVLNPKTALFFLAFLPQFVDRTSGNIALQTILLGAAFVALGVVSDGTYALAATAIRGRLTRSEKFARRSRIFTGVTYVGLGVTAAFTGRSKS
jgi:threonine/homoserine/homoserine lactone efflux protein